MPSEQQKKGKSLSKKEQILTEPKSQSSKLKNFVTRTCWLIFVIVTAIVILAPVLLHLYGDVILKRIFFQTWSRYYPWLDITKPENFYLNGVNVYEQTEPNVTVGIWYILPPNVEIDSSLKSFDEHMKKYVKTKDQPIIMYLHGQDGTRATHYRANHYRAMSSFGNHIVALDYRGYGDSIGSPDIHGVVHDTVYIFKRIREICPENPITVWGHSMGTGVALLAVKSLFQNQTKWGTPAGVVLEAPFYNTLQALISYPLTRILKINPYFMDAAIDSLNKVELNFPNYEIVSFLPLPIAVIHAEDDGIIPYHHAQLIQKYAKEHRDTKLPPVRLVTVPSGAGCGHNHIYLYEKFRDIVSDLSFVKQNPQV